MVTVEVVFGGIVTSSVKRFCSSFQLDRINPYIDWCGVYAAQAIENQIKLAGPGMWLFPSVDSSTGYLRCVKTAWAAPLRRAGILYSRIYDLRSTYATRRSAGGVADEWVTQLLRQGDAKVFKKYSQMKLQMKREALGKINRQANEGVRSSDTAKPN